jgi:hypothetical protein
MNTNPKQPLTGLPEDIFDSAMITVSVTITQAFSLCMVTESYPVQVIKARYYTVKSD